MNETTTTRETRRPPATPSGEQWQDFCHVDDPGAATRWFPGDAPPTTPGVRNAYRVTTIIVDEDDDGCRAGVYLYWPGRPETDENEEMVGPVRLDGERVLEELWRQHPDADKHEHDTLFEEIVEKMLTAHLINTCGKLWREAQTSAMGYAAIDNWSRKIEEAAEKTRSWRLTHG